ncbi:flippase [Methanosarcina sp. Mfa9]|uniref:flippase n=1 Tax=Methanosarcina sp. Mfa9 TaxID=3439063 RepID=UPI003F873E1B
MMRDVQWSFISLATASLSHLLLRIVLGKELGPSGLGLYTLVFTIYIFGMHFAAFGIGVALTKYLAEYDDDLLRIKGFVSCGLFGSIVSGSMMGVLMYLLSGIIAIQFFHSPEMVDLLKITAFCFPFIAMQKAVIGALNGLRKMKWFAIVNIAQHVSVMIVSIVLVVLLDMGVRGAVIGFVAPTIMVGVLSLIIVREYFSTKSASISTVLKEVLWFGFYIVLANSIGMINVQIDSLMVGHFMSETDVGYYAVAIIFVEGLRLIPDSVQRITTPAIANYYGKQEYENIHGLMKNSMLKVLAITIFISFTLILLGQFLIEVLFKEEFLPAYYPLLILLVGYSVYAPILSISGAFAGIGKVALMSKLSFICAVMNTILNILLIPKYGITGAAIATSISLIFTASLKLYFIKLYIPKPSAIIWTEGPEKDVLR